MKTLNIELKIQDKTFTKILDYFGNAYGQEEIEGIIGNNLEADLDSGDLSILDIMKPGLSDDE